MLHSLIGSRRTKKKRDGAKGVGIRRRAGGAIDPARQKGVERWQKRIISLN